MSSALWSRTRTPGVYARAVADSVVLVNMALIGVSTLGLIITSRYLGVSDRGLYLTWSSWCVMIGTLAMLGTQSFIVVAAGQLDTRVSVWRLKSMLWLGVAIAGLCALAAMTGLRAGPVAVFGGILLASSGPVVAVLAAVQQANGHHGWRFNVARGLSPVAGLLAVVATLVLFHPGAEGLFLALGAGCVMGAGLSVVMTREPASAESRLVPRIRSLARRGGALVLLGWLLLNVDTVVVSVAGSSDDVGLYGVGVAAKSVVLALGTAVGMRWFATRDAVGPPRRAVRPFVPALASALGIVLVAPMAVPLLLGSEFAPSVPTVQLLALGGVIASVDFLLIHVLLVRVGYGVPTVLRFWVVVALVAGILAVGGQATLSALVFCCVMLASVVGQTVLAAWEMRRPRH